MDFVVIGAEAFLYRAFPRGLRQRHRICEVRKKGETKKKGVPFYGLDTPQIEGAWLKSIILTYVWLKS